MSETASDIREPQSSPPAGDKAAARTEGGSSIREGTRPKPDEPTIITGRPPVPSPATGDSIARILEGRVMPGDRIGHFELVEYVGGGGMGRVFRATDTQLNRTVALKILAPEQATDPDALQRFQNEAHSSARLDHDNIARVFYVGEDRGLHFIVFEFIEGVNIRELVGRKGYLPLAEAVSYTLQVAEALSHADSRAVVHRDIKPSNVLITPEGRVKLIDMGLARLRHVDPAVADLTASGVTLGTFDYISPEQARDPRNADIRSDIYSLGCTFYFMLAGQPPFPEGTVLQKLLQHQGDQPPDILQVRPDLPVEASRVLRKMMAKDPRHRYASPADLVADLLLLAEQIGLRPISPTSRIWLVPQTPHVSFFARHLPWMVPLAALVGIVLLLDHFWSPSRQNEALPWPSIDTTATLIKPTTVPLGAQQPISLTAQQPVPLVTQQPAGRVVATPPAAAPAVPTPPATPAHKETPAAVIATKDAGARPAQGVAGQKSVGSGAAGLAFTPSGGGLSAGGNAASPQAPLTAGALHPPAATGASTAGSSTAAVTGAAKRPGLLVVTESPKGEDQFSTLAAACAAAHEGDTIELRFNGPREDRPVKLANVRLTVQAGEGFQPIVVFRPTDVDPVKHPRAMLTLATGQLTMIDVALELHVPHGVPADSWSLLETWGGETVRLERCWLTIDNTSDQKSTYHQDVAFFRARLAPDADASVGNLPTATPLATIELADCVARGEADFLHVEDMQPVHLTWDNGLLITTERLLAAGGSQAAPKLDEMLRIELRHVTAAARGGLCRLSNTSSDPYQLTVQFVSTNNILMTSTGVPLIEQEGTATVENFRQRFLWNGDRNFYQDVDVFWTVRSLNSETPPDVMGFEAWKAYWGPTREVQPSTERLLWKRPPDGDRALHAQGPADYTLEDPTFGDASGGTPGFQAHRLPQLPPAAGLLRPGPTGSANGGRAVRSVDAG